MQLSHVTCFVEPYFMLAVVVLFMTLNRSFLHMHLCNNDTVSTTMFEHSDLPSVRKRSHHAITYVNSRLRYLTQPGMLDEIMRSSALAVASLYSNYVP